MAAQLTLLDPELLERIKGLSLIARRVVEGLLHGLHKSPMRGLSIEFAQHREYSPGDELKRLDWQVLARSDRYVIKQYEQETNLRAVMFVDASASMAYGAPITLRGGEGERGRGGDGEADGEEPNAQDSEAGEPENAIHNPQSAVRNSLGGKFQYARTLAAALSYLMLHQGDSVGLMLTTDRIVDRVEPKAAPGHLLSICQVLELAQPAGRTHLAATLNELAGRLKRRSLVILISDLLDEPERTLSALGQIHHRGHETIVFQVLDPREMEFDLGLAGHGVTVIRDMETGEEFEAEPSLIRDLVRAAIRRFLDRLDAGARGHGIHLLRCPTDKPVEQVLTEYLHARLRSKR
jgi:uncharacterized protein (DUF58 family)